MRVVARHQGRCGEIALREGAAPDGSSVYEIILNGVFLMASYSQRSERALAKLALSPLLDGTPLRVLVGGLGMGFTLRAALTFRQVARVDVVEIEPSIVAWNRDQLAQVNDHALRDARVRLLQQDVVGYLLHCTDHYHAICLDVDNGPDWLVTHGNGRLYEPTMLRRLAELLEPNGVLTVWSADRSSTFEQHLQQSLGSVEVFPIVNRVGARRRAVSWIYRSRRPASSPK